MPWRHLASNWTPRAFSQSWSVYKIGGFYRNRSTVVKRREIVHSVSVRRSILFLYGARTLSRFIFEHLNFHFHPSHLISYLWGSCTGNLVPSHLAAFVNYNHGQKSVETAWNPWHPLVMPIALNSQPERQNWDPWCSGGGNQDGGLRHYRGGTTAFNLDIRKTYSVIRYVFYMSIP